MKQWKDLLSCAEDFCKYDNTYYDLDSSYIWLLKILEFNNIDHDNFFNSIKNVIYKTEMKINSIWFYGPSNAGKSLVANSIVESCRFFANIMDFDERSSFPLNDAPGKRVLLINEPDIGERRIELVKNIMEGQEVAINVKNQRGISLPRTLLIICSNKTLWHFCMSESTAILNRCYKFEFKTMDELLFCKKKLNPLMWLKFFNSHIPDLSKQVFLILSFSTVTLNLNISVSVLELKNYVMIITKFCLVLLIQFIYLLNLHVDSVNFPLH